MKRNKIIKTWVKSKIQIERNGKGIIFVVHGKNRIKVNDPPLNWTLEKAKDILDYNVSDVGTPSLYKPIYAEQAYKLCLLGATDKRLADFFGVTDRTINNWKKEFPEFFQSLRAGKELANMEVAKSMYDGAIDRTLILNKKMKLKTEGYDKNGKKYTKEEMVEYQEELFLPGEFKNQSFWLKNRDPENWKEKAEVENTHKIPDNFNVKNLVSFDGGDDSKEE